MRKLIVQVNHPGLEKAFNNKSPNGFTKMGELWVRNWNSEDRHFRKLLIQEGKYINSLYDKEQVSELMFWGEWEADSIFTPLDKGNHAFGIHKPFISKDKSNDLQNTDPYVFGSNFKYAICSQRGVMTQLDIDSLVLFGTTTDNGFHLDTVFVVKDSESAASVYKSKAAKYTPEYKKVTLDRISGCYLTSKCKSLKNRIYLGKSWVEDHSYFSFVPSKPLNKTLLNQGMEKLCIPFESDKLSFVISRQKVGHPYTHFVNRNPKEIWNELVAFTLEKGFSLGTFFSEPNYLKIF